jgi:hypothetical protein
MRCPSIVIYPFEVYEKAQGVGGEELPTHCAAKAKPACRGANASSH